MGGKTSTSTSAVSIPPEVLARYNSVNATAQQVAQTPFQQYSTNPNAFVQPLTPTQQAGIQNTNAAQGMAQPYYNAATGFSLAGAQPINAQPLNAQQYMNPYLGTVLGSTEAMINQQNQQAQSGQTGSAMSQGYFGGDRSGIASAVLAGQQQLAAGQTYSGIASDAYNQAMAAAQQQQGVNLGAAQANRAALTGTGEQLAGLGTTAQQTALAGAQAQLGAGQVEQQTGQAGLTALYNQFLQQQSYPFQTAQFLANIAEGTGALSGSTTTTQSPQSIFSDERLKEDMVPVGVGFDGANIYRFRYRGDPTTRVGFSAQEMERLHPEAVSIHPSGFKMVDYDKATRAAAGFAMAANDEFYEPEPRRMRAAGGRTGFQGGGMAEWGMYPSGSNPMAISQILAAQAQMYGPYSQAGLYGGQGASGGPYGGAQGHVPAASLPVGQLMIAHPAAQPQQGGLAQDIHQVANLADDAEGLSKDYHFAHEGVDKLAGLFGHGGGGGGMSTDDYRSYGGYAHGGSAEGDDDMRIARQGGGGFGDWWTSVSGDPTNPKTQAAIHRLVQARQAAQAQHQAAPRPSYDPSFAAPGTILGAVPGVQAIRQGIQDAPKIYHAGHQLYDADMQTDRMAGAYARAGLGAIGNAASNVEWAHKHGPGWKPTAPWSTSPGDYLGGSSGAPAGAQAGQMPGGAPHPGAVPPPLPPLPALAPGTPPAVKHAFAAAYHHGQANQHAAAARAGGIDPSQLPAPLPASTTAGDVAPHLPVKLTPGVSDLSNLQTPANTGFASANIQPYHEGFFQRIGDWLGGHFGSDAQRAGWDIAHNRADPIQSEAFQGTSPAALTPHQQLMARAAALPDTPPAASAPVIQSEAFQPRATPPPGAVAQPDVALVPAAPQTTEPIRSEAFQDATHPGALTTAADIPQLAARGGFARADGGAAKNPWNAVVSGSSNLTGRAHRQGGGPSDLSNPQNDDPYHPQGPGLNIPTAETQHPKLATAQPAGGGQSGGGLGQALGMGSDIASIGTAMSKFLPFIGLQTGGRAGYDDGGGVPVTPDDTTAPVPVQHDPAATDAAPPPAPKQTGFGNAAQPPPSSGQDGGGGFLGGLFHGVENFGKGVEHMLGNRDVMMPLLSAIGTAASVPTVHPLVALAAGLGGYGKAYMAQQANEANIAQTQATGAQTRFQTLPATLQKGMVEADGMATDPRTGQPDKANSHYVPGVGWKHWEMAANLLGGAGGAGGTAPAPGLATPQSQQGSVGGAGAPAAAATAVADQGISRGPLKVDYKTGTQSWAPSAVSDKTLGGMLNGDIDTSGTLAGAMRNQMLISARGLDGSAHAAEVQAATDAAGQLGYQNNSRQLQQLALAINAMPKGGMGAMGEAYPERQTLLKIAQTANRIIMGGDDPSLNDQMSQGDIIAKIKGLTSATLTQQAGLHAAEVQNMLNNILPGAGTANVDTANQLIASMMVNNQQAIDKPAFEQAYQAKYGTMLGADTAWAQESQGLYGEDQAGLMRMMKRGAAPGGDSMAEYLMKHPDQRRALEFGARKGNQFNPGVGIGLGRYWTERLT